ncbi:Pre-mRNA-processing protein 40A [Chlorella vulgaris]
MPATQDPGARAAAGGAPGAPVSVPPPSAHPGAAAPGSPGAAAKAVAAIAAARLAASQGRPGPALGAPAAAPAAYGGGGAGFAGQRPGGFPGAAASGAPGQMPGAAPMMGGGAAKPDWTEHTAPDGRKYFYNARTKQSSWEKPDELKTPQERAAAAAGPAGAAPPAASAWKEHTAPDGRKYYYNRVTKESRWQMPDEMRAALGLPAGGGAAPGGAATAAAAPAAAAGRPGPEAQVVKLTSAAAAAAGPANWVQTGPTPHYATTAEAKDAFKALLTNAGVSSGMNWDESMRLIVQDRRYGALKTLGEKKTAFNEYVQARKKEEAEEARQRRMQAKEGFYAMLDESKDLEVTAGYRPKFSRARDLLELDPRWQAVDSGKEREDLFEDWVDEKEKLDKEARKAETKRKRAAFRELLERSTFIKFDTSWRKAQDRLAGEPDFDALDKLDRLAVYEEYIRELERLEREEREKEKEERRRQERQHRDAFRALLAKHREEGIINAHTRWKEYVPIVAEEESYKAVERNTSGSRPRELFQDVLEEMEAEYGKQRDAVKAAVKELSLQVGVDSQLEAFREALAPRRAEGGELAAVSDTSIKLYHDELLGRAKEEAYRAEKKHRRAREDFAYMLKHMRDIRPDTTWEEAAAACGEEPEWGALDSEEEKRALFGEFIEKLKAKEAERAERKRGREDGGGGGADSGSDREGDRRDKKKKHKKDKKSRHQSDASDDDERRSKKHKDRRHKERTRSRSKSERSQRRVRSDTEGLQFNTLEPEAAKAGDQLVKGSGHHLEGIVIAPLLAAMAQQDEARCELLVVGAGPAALHLVARLPDKLRQDTVVVDRSGGWLHDWTARQNRLAAPLLRTPVQQHPHAAPLALQAYVEKHGRQQELVPVFKGFAPVPHTSLFLNFCSSDVIGELPAALRTPCHDTVLRIEPLAGSAGCRVHLASGKVLAAQAVVYTPANRSPVIPAWAKALPAAPPHTPPAETSSAPSGSEPAEAGGEAVADELAATPAEQAQPPASASSSPAPLPAGMQTWDSVDLRTAELAGKRVVVVGGGMSAGLLAAGAAERGAHVTLVCRRPLKPQPFEVDVGWWGAKQLSAFRQVDSSALRLRSCQRARRQGSVHLPVWRRLTQQAVAGRLTVLEGWEVASAGQLDGSQGSWRLTLKPYFHEQTREQAAAPSLFQQAVAATAAVGQRTGASQGVPNPQAGATPQPDTAPLADAVPTAPQTPLPAQQQQQPPPQQQQQQEVSLETQLVWLCCGSAYDAAADPVLRGLQLAAPTLLAGGYACLDDEHLCWPGAGAYIAGRGALLSVGPTAGDLPGMRLAADRIAASLRRLGYADGPVWASAQQSLLRRLCTSDATGSSSSSSAAAAGEADVVSRLAAAVAAATAALGPLPLEAEGLPFEDPKPKVSVSKPSSLIDVSDLSPALPRRELQQYKMIDDEFELTVVCQLEEGVPLDKVRVLFGERQLEMWAVGQVAAYHLHVPRLYGRIIVKKCKFKVNQKARKVFLMLQKDSDAEPLPAMLLSQRPAQPRPGLLIQCALAALILLLCFFATRRPCTAPAPLAAAAAPAQLPLAAAAAAAAGSQQYVNVTYDPLAHSINASSFPPPKRRAGFKAVDNANAIKYDSFVGDIVSKMPFETVLDAGTGNGQLVRARRARNRAAWGIELSQAVLERDAADLLAAGLVEQGSLTDLPYADSQFDLVFSADVLEHILPDQADDVVRELVRVAKRDLVLSISLKSIHNDELHTLLRPRARWEALFAEHGAVPNRALVWALQQKDISFTRDDYSDCRQEGDAEDGGRFEVCTVQQTWLVGATGQEVRPHRAITPANGELEPWMFAFRKV